MFCHILIATLPPDQPSMNVMTKNYTYRSSTEPKRKLKKTAHAHTTAVLFTGTRTN